MLNNIVGYTGLIFRGAYIWNEVSVSIHVVGLYTRGLYSGGAYIQRYTLRYTVDTHFSVHIEQLIRWALKSIKGNKSACAIYLILDKINSISPASCHYI